MGWVQKIHPIFMPFRKLHKYTEKHTERLLLSI